MPLWEPPSIHLRADIASDQINRRSSARAGGNDACNSGQTVSMERRQAALRGEDVTAYSNSALLAPQSHHDVNAGNLVAFGRDRRLADQHIVRRNVHEIVAVFDEEVVVLGIIGVEI